MLKQVKMLSMSNEIITKDEARMQWVATKNKIITTSIKVLVSSKNKEEKNVQKKGSPNKGDGLSHILVRKSWKNYKRPTKKDVEDLNYSSDLLSNAMCYSSLSMNIEVSWTELRVTLTKMLLNNLMNFYNNTFVQTAEVSWKECYGTRASV